MNKITEMLIFVALGVTVPTITVASIWGGEMEKTAQAVRGIQELKSIVYDQNRVIVNKLDKGYDLQRDNAERIARLEGMAERKNE
ncbi:TMhelix containing protein [Vibrio phage 1.262.O._10N.286.51.A9]|nr:TMhelix containing protein [Vibrio phage 1.262.O._10N.286.51.A9]